MKTNDPTLIENNPHQNDGRSVTYGFGQKPFSYQDFLCGLLNPITPHRDILAVENLPSPPLPVQEIMGWRHVWQYGRKRWWASDMGTIKSGWLQKLSTECYLRTVSDLAVSIDFLVTRLFYFNNKVDSSKIRGSGGTSYCTAMVSSAISKVQTIGNEMGRFTWRRSVGA